MRWKWIAIALMAIIVLAVGFFLWCSYGTSNNCKPHAKFFGQTVIEYCLP